MTKTELLNKISDLVAAVRASECAVKDYCATGSRLDQNRAMEASRVEAEKMLEIEDAIRDLPCSEFFD